MSSLDKQRMAAVGLAVTASRLRDCDDALVALGREVRESGLPSYSVQDEAKRLVGRVSVAYGEMRVAEKEWEAVRDA